MKFSTLKREPVTHALDVPLPGIATPTRVLVRQLSSDEEQKGVAFATKAAVDAAVRAERGVQLYDVALWAHAVAAAYLDAENPGAPFFDGGPAQVLEKLGIDSIAYLFRAKQRWEDEVSPLRSAKNPDQFVNLARDIAGPNGDEIYMRCAPATQLGVALFMARLLTAIEPDDESSGAATAPGASSAPVEAPSP